MVERTRRTLLELYEKEKSLKDVKKMEKKQEPCPHAKSIAAGDEAMDYCEVNEDRLCVLEEGKRCKTYDDILKEWEEEE